MRKPGKILIGIVLVPVTLVLAAGLHLALFKDPVSLNLLKEPLQARVQQQLGWRLEIRGDVFLVPGLSPSLEIAEAALLNPEASHGEFFFARRIYLDLDLLALLDRNLEIGEVSITDLRLALRIDEQGEPNWRLGGMAASGGRQDAPAEPQAAAGDSLVEMLEGGKVKFNLSQIRLDDINFSYEDRMRNTEFIAAIDEGLASLRWDAPMILELQGHSNNIPVEFELEASAVSRLMSRGEDWQGKIGMRAGKVDMTFDVALDATPGEELRDPSLRLEVHGNSLTDMVELLEVPLPPWGPYRFGGKISLSDSGYRLEDVAIGIGQSNLTGNVTVDIPDDHPKFFASLRSELIDTRDFEIGQWQGFEYDSQSDDDPAPDAAAESRSLLDAGLLQTLHVDVDIVFDEIRSGNDELGNGEISLLAAGGRIGVEKFEASIPGGLVRARMILQPGVDSIRADVSIEAKDFDYGILARRNDPDSTNKGRLFLDVNVAGESDSLDNLLSAANGHIDLAVWPEEFEAGAFDLWAVGLLSSAASRYGDPSLVNCVVARFKLEDGVMTQRAIMMDTSEIRVIGDGTIDFHSRTVDLYLVPKAKRAALISIAVPVGINGRFQDFDLAIHSDDVVKSVFRNTANIVFLGLPLLFHKPLEADGNAACKQAMLTDIDLTVKRPGDVKSTD